MKELLYFSSSDLMIQVSYKKEVNSIHYLSHRELSFGERVVVEQYLLTNIAIKTDYYKKHPAMLNYIGIDNKLVKELNQFHLKNTMNTLQEKEDEVTDSVKNLIDQSLSNYYFEQIGNTLIKIRSLADIPDDSGELHRVATRLKELVVAYNAHSDSKVAIDEIVPRELRGFVQ